MEIYDPNGNRTPLGERLGGGGEAEIFGIGGEPELVAKIYRNPTRYREEKLRAMIANPPKDPTLPIGHTSICWPKSLLFDQAGACVGFSMHRVDVSTHVPALRLYNPQDRQGVSLDITWKYLVRAATNIAAAVEAIHAQGHVIGDFNESNLLVANNALVTLVDCDSMQISDPVRGTCFRCPVGKPEFTPPELQGCEFSNVDRNSAHDNFGLGVMIFLLLMEGVHPFSGVWRKKGDPPILEERIRAGISPCAGHPDVDEMPGAPRPALLPKGISALFFKCFRDGHAAPSRRPTPSEWAAALSELEQNLRQCSVSDRHFFGGHMPYCPWCERKVMLGGIDPFPDQVQRVARGPRQVAAAPVQVGPAAAQPGPGANQSQPAGRSKFARSAVALSATAVLLAVVWIFARGPIGRIWFSVNSALTDLVISDRRPTLSPPLLCTGVDASGVPTGVAESFSQEQVRDTGVTVFLTYTGAVPQQSTFQMKLIINGNVLESKVNTFERKADFLQLKLGNDLPSGEHKIEFLVDGKLQQSASLVIYGDSPAAAGPSVAARLPARPPRRPPALRPGTTAPPVEPSSPVPVVVPSAPVQETAPQPQPAPPPAQSAPLVATYEITHWHSIGSCAGELKLTPRTIEFVSDRHVFKFGITEVKLEKDGILDPSGKAWHFSIAGVKIEQVLGRWKREELFPKMLSTQSSTTAADHPTAASTSPPAAASHRYPARHKHRLGSCSGDIKLTPRSIEYTSGEHSFTYAREEVQIDGDGIRDRSGRVWRLDIPGEDTAEILREWKAGKLGGK